MKVPEYLASDIVDRMKNIINHHINFINTDGIIIASTNSKRVGDMHEGAQRVLKIRDKVIIYRDNEYKGAKAGINIPVFFEEDIIGVIGITGQEDQVSKYAEIMQNMTEILVKEAYLTEKNNIERESKKQLIEELLFRLDDGNDSSIRVRADLLDVKLNIPRTVVMARVEGKNDGDSYPQPPKHYKIYNLINRYIDFDDQNLLFQSGMQFILILNLETINELDNFIDYIYSKLSEEDDIVLYFGVGETSFNTNGIKKSYEEAKKALNVATTINRKNIVKYNEMSIELILSELPDVTKEKFTARVFGEIDIETLSNYLDFLTIYFQTNGSITQTAEKLFIHKNTVQYKLKKIQELTGYDPRIIDDLVELYLATLIYKY